MFLFFSAGHSIFLLYNLERRVDTEREGRQVTTPGRQAGSEKVSEYLPLSHRRLSSPEGRERDRREAFPEESLAFPSPGERE